MHIKKKISGLEVYARLRSSGNGPERCTVCGLDAMVDERGHQFCESCRADSVGFQYGAWLE